MDVYDPALRGSSPQMWGNCLSGRFVNHPIWFIPRVWCNCHRERSETISRQFIPTGMEKLP